MANPIQLIDGLDYDDYDLILSFCYMDEVPDRLKPYATPHANDTIREATSDELKSLLKAHGLKVSGNKADLIARVRENIPEDAVLSTLRNVVKFDKAIVRIADAVDKMEQSFEGMDVKAAGLSFGGFAGRTLELMRKYPGMKAKEIGRLEMIEYRMTLNPDDFVDAFYIGEVDKLIRLWTPPSQRE